ncbi:unnamed protein product [Auanema sp. JU1783]|nr:unnamed protein product [Auanema sp. JU1783]
MGPYNESNIYFYAENLDLRDQIDFLEFYDGLFLMPDEDAMPSHRCTGRGECKYNTETNLLTIKFVSDTGDSENFGFQGTVSAYNRQLRLLKNSVGRFCIPIAIILILLIAFVTLLVCCRKRSRELRHKETEELLDDHVEA